jgi:hypothetical protein
VDGAAELDGDGAPIGDSDDTGLGFELVPAEFVGDATGLGDGLAQPAVSRTAARNVQPRPGLDPIRMVPTARIVPPSTARSS